MRKTLLVLSLLAILLLAVTGISQADSLSFLGFTIGDSTQTCAAQMHQLQEKGQINNYYVINQNQVVANLEISDTPAILLLTFKDDYLASIIFATDTNPDLKKVVQQLSVELQGLIKKFGEPASIDKDIDADKVNQHKFTSVAVWEYDDGEEMSVGIYYNGQIYSIYLIMQVSTIDGPTT